MPRPTRNTKNKDWIKIEKRYLKKVKQTKGQPEAKRRKKTARFLNY